MIKHVSEMTLAEKIEAAFLKASYRVLETARQKKTPIAISRDGKVVLVSPEEIQLPPMEFSWDEN